MPRRRRGDEDPSMDSLMDAMTNVVGILLLILIVTSLGLSNKVAELISNLPEITQEQLDAMKSSRKKTLDNLKDLKATYAKAEEQAMDPDEATQLALNLENFEKENADLAEKTSDLEELFAKAKELEPVKDEKEVRNSELVTKLNDLQAALADKPEREEIAAREITLPDPRVADPEAYVYYVVCKNQKVYVVGDPYQLMVKMRDVLDKNFKDLAYTGTDIGSYVHPLQDEKRKSSIKVDFRARSKREQEALGYMNNIQLKSLKHPQGRSVFQNLMGGNEEAQKDKKEWPVRKMRFDSGKVKAFFAQNAGKGDFTYIPQFRNDRIRLEVQPNPEGGLGEDRFLANGSPFVEMVRLAKQSRRAILMYYVAYDSFDIYLKARDYSASQRLGAGWLLWEGDRINNLVPNKRRDSMTYSLLSLPHADYAKLSQFMGPKVAAKVNAKVDSFEADLGKVPVPEGKDAAEFKAGLKKHRGDWLNGASWYVNELYMTPLAASEADSNTQVGISVHPPEIMHVRIFVKNNEPNAPRPPPKTGGGGGKKDTKPPLILD